MNWLEKFAFNKMINEGKTAAEAMAHINRVRAMPEYVIEDPAFDNASDDSYDVSLMKEMNEHNFGYEHHEGEIAVGMKVWVKGGFGMEEPKEVTVIGVGENKGKPCFDYQYGEYPRWAYVSQIVERGGNEE